MFCLSDCEDADQHLVFHAGHPEGETLENTNKRVIKFVPGFLIAKELDLIGRDFGEPGAPKFTDDHAPLVITWEPADSFYGHDWKDYVQFKEYHDWKDYVQFKEYFLWDSKSRWQPKLFQAHRGAEDYFGNGALGHLMRFTFKLGPV